MSLNVITKKRLPLLRVRMVNNKDECWFFELFLNLLARSEVCRLKNIMPLIKLENISFNDLTKVIINTLIGEQESRWNLAQIYVSWSFHNTLTQWDEINRTNFKATHSPGTHAMTANNTSRLPQPMLVEWGLNLGLSKWKSKALNNKPHLH